MLDPLSISIPLSSPRPERPIHPTRKLLQPSTEHPDDYVLELDYSSLSKFISCPRSAENYLLRSRESVRDSSATQFGKLFHSCEELRLLHGWSDSTKVAQHELIAEHFLHNPPIPGDHRTADRMVDLLQKYNERYINDGWPQRTFHEGRTEPFVEVPFKVQLCTIPVNADVPYFPGVLVVGKTHPKDGIWLDEAGPLPVRNLHIFYTGRIDAVLHDSNLLWVVDHKTSSRGGREFEEAFRLSLQTRGYVWAAQKLLGLPIAGLIMNAVVIRPLTKTGTGTEFNRHSYLYSQASLDEWENNVKAIVSDFVACLLRGYFPQYAQSFKSPCSMCDYAENCALPPEQRSDDLASELFRDVTWNPVH